MATPGRSPADRVGPYTLVRRLGAGSIGEVWEAVFHGPSGFRKRVALKLVRAGAAGRELVREARLGALLQHPNVVGTLQLGEHDGTWCIALELVDGPSVQALARRLGGALPPHAVLDVGAQVAAGLEHVHSYGASGLVHRDVKPANLLVDRSGLVKLADLGISLLREEVGVSQVAGTPGYMAPEQALGSAVPASDLFSLGVVLYTLACGRHPFGRGEGALEVVASVEAMLARPGFLAPVEAAVPGLGSIARWCLRADPAERPRSARALADALTALRPRQASGPSLLEVLARAVPELGLAVSATPVSDVPTRIVPAGNVRPGRDVFVGRAAELEAVQALVAEQRWVVLFGPGGTGKTRLAVEVARRLRPTTPGGTWVADLSAAVTVEGLCAAVAGALGLELDLQDGVDRVGQAIGAKGRALVVLDNLEQLVEVLPATVGRWLDLAPACTFLGTSRVVPGLAGERTVPLGEMSEDDAVALFLERSPRALSEAERAEVRPLARALEGMPLSIELAAARLRALTVPGIRSRLSLALLAGGGSERPHRHRSVVASLRWSWELLGTAARSGMGQVAVFEGSFDPRAAEAVLDLPGGAWALDVLQELVEASLVRVDPVRGRFRLAAPVREFAIAQLAPEDRAAAVARHGAFYAQLGAPEAVEALDGPGGQARYRALLDDVDDVVAACRRAIARGAADVAARTLRAAHVVFERQGDAGFGAKLAVEVLSMPSLGIGDRARAELCAGWALQAAGRPTEALPHLERALALHRECGDGRGEAAVMLTLGNVHVEQGRNDAGQELLEAGLALHRARGDRRGEARALAAVGVLRALQARGNEAVEAWQSALALHREVGNRRGEGSVLGNLGVALIRLGRTEDARAHYVEALEVLREVGYRRTEGTVLMNLGRLHAIVGRPDEAVECWEQALALVREVGARRTEGGILGNLGGLHHTLGRLSEARGLLERALAIHVEVGDRGFAAKQELALADLDAEEGGVDAAMARYERGLALARELGARTDEGRALDHVAHLLVASGRTAEGRATAERALAIHRDVGTPHEEVQALVTLGLADLEDGRLDEAIGGFRDAVERLRTSGMHHLPATVLTYLGDAHGERGDAALARACYEEAAAGMRAYGDPVGEASALSGLARGEDPAVADPLLDRAEAALRRAGVPARLGLVLVVRAEVRLRAGDRAGAAAALEEAAGLAPWHARLGREVARVRAMVGYGGGVLP